MVLKPLLARGGEVVRALLARHRWQQMLEQMQQRDVCVRLFVARMEERASTGVKTEAWTQWVFSTDKVLPCANRWRVLSAALEARVRKAFVY